MLTATEMPQLARVIFQERRLITVFSTSVNDLATNFRSS